MITLIESELTSSDTRAEPVPDRLPRDWTWLNWLLALLTAPGAALVMMFALNAAVGTPACSTVTCPGLGPGGLTFDLLYYGAPVVAGLTIVLAFFTATQRRGIIVSLCGVALLLADLAVLAMTLGG